MSIQYIHAKQGYEFQPTYLGKMEGRIDAKYREDYQSDQYRKCVPKKWISKDWVREVKKENA